MLLTIGGLWLAVLLVAAGPAVAWVYTEKWSPAVPALVLFGLALNLDMATFLGGTAMNSLGRVGLATRIVGVRTALNLVIAVAAIAAIEAIAPGRGFLGVPLAYLVSVAVMTVWMGVALRQTLGVNPAAGLAWLAWPLGLSVAAGLTTRWLLPEGVAPLWLRAVAPAAVSGFSYAAAVAWAGPASWRTAGRERMAVLGRRMGVGPRFSTPATLGVRP